MAAPGGDWITPQGGLGGCGGGGVAGSFSERAAKDALELSLVEDAEVVFATLSATGRRILQVMIIQWNS